MSNFFWIGGRLWLDAVNSEFMSDGQRVDGWSGAEALESWLREAGERHEEARALREFSHLSGALLEQAKSLRAALRLACTSAQAGGVALEAALQINEALRHRGVVLQVEAREGEGGWREREILSGEAEDALWLVARSAARSWARGELARLKPCANSNCILWFLDTSKNNTRRWCSMDGCGNRHKAATHHQKRKAEAGPTEL